MSEENAKQTVLVVDDERHIVKILQFNLAKNGYNVLCAFDGEEALDVLSRQRPDLVILDVMMPKMNGYQVCEAIKGDPETTDLPVILLTAKGQEIDRESGLAKGADRYVTKPFSPRNIIQTVKELLA